MTLSTKLNSIKSVLTAGKSEIIKTSKEGYKIWAESYDDEKDNLMLYYDEIIFSKLLNMTNCYAKTILDFGCGTGRNWHELVLHHPARIIGSDISPEMLTMLKNKFTGAETYLINDNKLDFLKKNECDLIISTLVISHIKDIENLFNQWDIVLKDSGEIIITDFHPDLFSKGGARTFKFKEKSYKIANYIHAISEIEKILNRLNFKTVHIIEEIIDEKVKPFYLRKNAEHIYERFKGTPFIYGIHLKR